MRLHRAFALCLLVFFCQSGYAQALVQGNVLSRQPKIERDGNGFVACGLSTVITVNREEWVEVHHLSLLVNGESMLGLFDAAKTNVSQSNARNGKYVGDMVKPTPMRFWIAKETDSKALIPIEIVKSGTPGHITGKLDFSRSFGLLAAMMHGERVQFVLGYEDQSIDEVISFSERLPRPEASALAACLNGVRDRVLQKRKSLESPR